MNSSRIESIERTVAGLIAMNRLLKNRVAALEQAMLETAGEIRRMSEAGELVSPFAPASDSAEAKTRLPA